MATPIDFCSRCATTLYAEDGVPGGCACPEGQLKQLLAARKSTPVPVPQTLPRAPTPRVASGPTALQREIQAAQSLSEMFIRDRPMAVSKPVDDAVLASLWSTESTTEDDGPGVTVESAGLESLWMGRVARETGEYAGTGMDLDAAWMNEILSNRPVVSADDISFDDTGIDAELSSARRSPSSGASGSRFRVDRPPPPRPFEARQVLPDARTVMSRNEARTRAEQMGRAVPKPVAASPTRRTASDIAREYASRETYYQQLMDDD